MAAAVETNRFDAAEYLTSADDQAALLAGALESGDAQVVAHALGVIARTRGMTDVARAAKMTCESMDRA